MSDLIDRQAAIDEAEEWIDAVYCDHDEQRERDAIRHVINGIKELPSAQPERKTGKWIQKSKPLDFCTEWWYECSECGSKPPNDRYGHPNYLADFCPDCGADMRGKTNEKT